MSFGWFPHTRIYVYMMVAIETPMSPAQHMIRTQLGITQQYLGKTLLQNAPLSPFVCCVYVSLVLCFFVFLVYCVLCNKQQNKTNTNDGKKGKGTNTRFGKS